MIGVQRGDDPAAGARLLERVLSYRVFPDAAGRMNLSLREVAGGLLLVPQFTLAADTDKGTRAGFSTAAHPRRRGSCSLTSSPARRLPMLLFPQVYLGPTCRCHWSMTVR